MTNKRQPRYKAGQKIGRRFLVHRALMGGMGEVYLCLDTQDIMPVALKTFQSSSPGLHDIFRQEVANWIALEKHPNIVRCFLMENYDDIPFMVLEWVAGDKSRGTDLRDWLRRGPLDLPLALRFTIDIVRGLQYANEKSPGIVHRDLKPDNVLVNQIQKAKITDFGLAMVAREAKLAIGDGDTGETLGYSRHVGNIVGTPPYMPPEQWRGETDLDFRTDMYAVGCILYESLTGRWPYAGHTVGELRVQHLEAPLPRLEGDYPLEIRIILDGCLAKRREDRFENLDLLLTSLVKLYEAHSDKPLPDVTTEPFTAADYNNRGLTFANLGQDERAIADYDAALRLDSALASVYYNRAGSYSKLGQHESALTDFDTTICLDPTDAEAYRNRGISYSELGQEEQAIADFDRAIQLDPTDAQTYMNRGLSYGELGQHERAISDYDAAIRLNPAFAEAYTSRGHSYSKLGQDERAIEDYDTALRLNGTDATAHYNRGVSWSALGYEERAIEDYDEALRLDPADAQAYYNRGNSYSALGKKEQAITDYDAAIHLNPTDPILYSNRGASYHALGYEERAIEDYDEALRLDPALAQAHGNRGVSFAALGKHEQAIKDYDAVIRLNPTDAQAYFNLGVSYSNLDQYGRAIEAYDATISLNPALAPAYLNKAVSLAMAGRVEEAIEWGEQAARLGVPRANEFVHQMRQRLGRPVSQSQQDEQEQIIRQLVSIYRQVGEAGLRQFLQQNDVPTAQTDEIVAAIKQIIAGG